MHKNNALKSNKTLMMCGLATNTFQYLMLHTSAALHAYTKVTSIIVINEY